MWEEVERGRNRKVENRTSITKYNCVCQSGQLQEDCGRSVI